jgi:hypothetical protein
MGHGFEATIIDHERFIENAKRMRAAALDQHLADVGRAATRPFRAMTRGTVSLSLAACGIAVMAFWAATLTTPSRTQASVERVEIAMATPSPDACLVSLVCP